MGEIGGERQRQRGRETETQRETERDRVEKPALTPNRQWTTKGQTKQDRNPSEYMNEARDPQDLRSMCWWFLELDWKEREGEGKRGRDREREGERGGRETDRQRGTETERDRETETERQRETETERDRQREGDRQRQTERQREACVDGLGAKTKQNKN